MVLFPLSMCVSDIQARISKRYRAEVGGKAFGHDSLGPEAERVLHARAWREIQRSYDVFQDDAL